jgi:predicted GTPase
MRQTYEDLYLILLKCKSFPEFSTRRLCCVHILQIPHIACSRYPAALSGPLYPEGLPIWPQSKLAAVISEQRLSTAVLAYSDLALADVAQLGAAVRAAGANFMLLGR